MLRQSLIHGLIVALDAHLGHSDVAIGVECRFGSKPCRCMSLRTPSVCDQSFSDLDCTLWPKVMEVSGGKKNTGISVPLLDGTTLD